MAENAADRARDYRATAGKLRIVAQQCHDPSVEAEILWLAQSYERLAVQADHGEEHSHIIDDGRSLEIPAFVAQKEGG